MTNEAASKAVAEPFSEPAAIKPLIVEPRTQVGGAQLWQPWTLIIPALLLLPLLGLAISWQISPSIDEALRQPTRRHSPIQPTEQATPMNSNGAWQHFTIFVPGDDELLHSIPINAEAVNVLPRTRDEACRAALQTLVVSAPDYFPEKTMVQSVRLEQTESEGNIAHVSLSEEFWNSDYWAMDSRTRSAVKALAQTTETFYKANGIAGSVQVLLLRDEQPVSLLGELDVADAIPTDESALGAPMPPAPSVPAPPAATWPAPNSHSAEPTPAATVAAP